MTNIDKKKLHIAVSGNIGSGKTTLTGKLARHYNWIPQFEPIDDNPYLADFYDDMKRWAFHLQIYFLNSRFNLVNQLKETDKTVIQDRTIYEDAYIFAANLHQSGYINDRDYKNYLNVFNSMIKYVTPPDLLIYLRADIPILVQQIGERGREFEEKIRIEYLKNLNKFYEKWISNYRLGKLLIIDVNNLNFADKVEDFAFIVDKVDLELHGLFTSP